MILRDETFKCFVISGMILGSLLILSACSESVLYRTQSDEFSAWVESMRKPTESATVEAIGNWMRANMKYEPDGVLDYFKPWNRSWNQVGDCEDFAGVACEALTRLGFTTYRIVSVFHPDGGHSVCSNGIWFLGNWPVTHVGAPIGDWRSVAYAVYSDWDKIIVRDYNLNIIEEVRR